MNSVAPHQRFREARERLRLSPDETASRCGIASANVWDIEAYHGELASCYSAKDVLRFSQALQVQPIDFFGEHIMDAPVSATELAGLVHDECSTRMISLEQFEEAVGWKLKESLDPPERLLEDLSLDGLQWLCRELHIDWRRVLVAL